MTAQGRIDLQQILSNKKHEISACRDAVSLEEMKTRAEALSRRERPRDFKKALKRGRFSVIAEIKKGSPSHGILHEELDVKHVARDYDKSEHVSCISVLTDKEYFGCGRNDMSTVRKFTEKPVLRKDFIIDDYQVYEARAYGADAVLLIASLLGREKLRRFSSLVMEMGMEPFIECSEKEHFSWVPKEARVVGINNRNLHATDLKQTAKPGLKRVKELLPFVPRGKVVISESGCKTSVDMKEIYDLGRISAVLIGAAIIEAKGERGQRIEGLMKDIPRSPKGSILTRLLRPLPTGYSSRPARRAATWC
ncbi:MAG: indole-3-glycerol phosphate synthase TrpC [Kiritimatiellia bacterium]